MPVLRRTVIPNLRESVLHFGNLAGFPLVAGIADPNFFPGLVMGGGDRNAPIAEYMRVRFFFVCARGHGEEQTERETKKNTTAEPCIFQVAVPRLLAGARGARKNFIFILLYHVPLGKASPDGRGFRRGKRYDNRETKRE